MGAQSAGSKSVRFENPQRDAVRAFDRSQKEIRLRRIEPRMEQVQQSRSAR